MTDDEYIRPAVELADGFLDCGSYFVTPDRPMGVKYSGANQSSLDALAAQLVRQVDRTDRYSFFSHRDCATVTEYVDGYPNEFGGAIGRDNRTMNTIKAIVDSQVLS